MISIMYQLYSRLLGLKYIFYHYILSSLNIAQEGKETYQVFLKIMKQGNRKSRKKNLQKQKENTVL